MSVRIAARSGLYRLRTWHDGEGSGGHSEDVRRSLPRDAVDPHETLHFRGDLLGAEALVRELSYAPSGLLALRAMLGRRQPAIHRLEDAEVLGLLAREIASGGVVVERAARPALASYDVGATESEAREPEQVTSQPVAAPEEPKQPEARPRPPPPPKKTWVEIALIGMDGGPVPGEAYKITLPDGSTREGVLDKDGRARVLDIDPGQCVVTFPGLDEDAWETI